MKTKAINILLLLILSIGTVSCIHESLPACVINEEPTPPVDKADELTLALNISFTRPNGSTRATAPDGYDPASGDFEKVKTLRVIIIHELNEEKTQGVVEANRLVNTSDEGYPLYDDLEFKVIANEYKRIYLIANEATLTPPVGSGATTASKYLDSFKPVKFGDDAVMTDLTPLADWTVAIPSVTNSTETITEGIFSQSTATCLPQTEFFDIFVEREKATDDYCYTNLFITRSAAKARFFLDTSLLFSTDENVNLKNSTVTAITLSGIGITEYVFPKNTVYSRPKENLISSSVNSNNKIEAYITQFETPGSPESAKTVTYSITPDKPITIEKPKDSDLIEIFAGSDIKAKPISDFIYFPESILEAGKKYRVGVQINDRSWFYADLESNILTIDEGDDSKCAIARNTYLPIIFKFDSAAELTVDVVKWTPENYEFDFTDQVGQNDQDFLTLGSNTYQSVNWTNGEVVLKPFPNVFSGTFGLSSPIGARWDAYLVTLTGTQDMIQFRITDAGGNVSYSNHISGTIGTNKTTFRVAPTTVEGSETRSAILQVTVTMLSGLTVPVNILLNGEGGDNKFAPGVENIIFVQHPN